MSCLSQVSPIQYLNILPIDIKSIKQKLIMRKIFVTFIIDSKKKRMKKEQIYTNTRYTINLLF